MYVAESVCMFGASSPRISISISISNEQLYVKGEVFVCVFFEGLRSCTSKLRRDFARKIRKKTKKKNVPF